jgi:AbrB family looped-hinge helix DNA binding protein
LRYQVTIPQIVREKLGLQAGDRLDFQVDEEATLVVRPVAPGKDVHSMFGMLAHLVHDRVVPTVEEMDDAVRQAVAEDDARIMREYIQLMQDENA